MGYQNHESVKWTGLMILIYIHGATATAESFNYLREHIGGQDLAIEYDSAHGFKENLEEMARVLEKYDQIFLIAHSLGGIYSLHLANLFPEKIIGAVTISTPYGGAENADYVKYFLPFSRLLRDIGPNSWPMRTVRNLKILHPWTNIVTIRGSSPWMLAPNDGVVSINSMSDRPEMDLIELEYNHYEIMLSPKTAEIIKRKIKEVHE